MTEEIPATNLSILSLVKEAGELDLSLAAQPMPEPKDHEVLVRVQEHLTQRHPLEEVIAQRGALGCVVLRCPKGVLEATLHDGLREILAEIPSIQLERLWIYDLETDVLIRQDLRDPRLEVQMEVTICERLRQAPYTRE